MAFFPETNRKIIRLNKQRNNKPGQEKNLFLRLSDPKGAFLPSQNSKKTELFSNPWIDLSEKKTNLQDDKSSKKLLRGSYCKHYPKIFIFNTLYSDAENEI